MRLTTPRRIYVSDMITLVRSHFRDNRPAILLLESTEESVLKYSTWRAVDGPFLFRPVKLSTRFYTFCGEMLHPVLQRTARKGAILSLGLPYRHYLLGKTFPQFAHNYQIKGLWTYDVWEPAFDEFEALVREVEIDVLLLSSYEATRHFRNLRIPNCEVHWVPEFIDAGKYKAKPWDERTVDIIAFGRQSPAYHERIDSECRKLGLNYLFQPRVPTWNDLTKMLADSKICICFPRSVTNPEVAGNVSTMTLRYLEGMAAQCVLLGNAPAEAKRLLGYSPVIEVDWQNPIGQLQELLQHGPSVSGLIERNLWEVNSRLHVRRFVERLNRIFGRRLRHSICG